MYRILSASKDTYITNKIINNRFRATDANVGEAGTIDLFKLSDENALSSETTPKEISRALIKFDLSPLNALITSDLDINHSSFQCFLKLHDIYGGQTTPSNFKLISFPLAKNFDEGIGRDVVTFKDLDASNFITASVSNGSVVAWTISGALASGSLGSENIDVYVSGNLSGPSGTSYVNLTREQTFATGKEDFEVDITNVISGVLTSQIPDYGFCVAFSGSYEQDNKTYFVKRFASKNSSNTRVRPKLIVKYDDTVQDAHRNFIFNVSGSLFLNNLHRGQFANILSGAAATELSGMDCLTLTVKTGSIFSKSVSVSQKSAQGLERIFETGIYTASFAISEFESSTLRSHILTSGSITFDEIWGSNDGTVGFYTGSLTVKGNEKTAYFNTPNRILLTLTNLQPHYNEGDSVKIRVFAENRDRPISYTKLPIEKPSQIYNMMFYRVRDFESGDIIIPFDTSLVSSTKLSTDSQGMFFNFDMGSLSRGRSYVFDFLIKDDGFDQVIDKLSSKFFIE
jgi:hypothetical protein